MVPAYDRRGSNCILRRPASIIPLRFGNDSFLPHCEAMKETGKELIILEMPGIGLDIDNPHELDCCWRAKETPTRNGCCARGISGRNPNRNAWKRRLRPPDEAASHYRRTLENFARSQCAACARC